MRIKLDENLPVEVAVFLNENGHDVKTVAEEGLSGAADEDLIQVSINERRTLLSQDLGFADIRACVQHPSMGAIVLRPGITDKHSLIQLVARLLPNLTHAELSGQIWIVEPHRIRIREVPV